jgi:hypothetical protein
MGHRALVAYERTDGNYNVHYSHWGASSLRLKHAITEATPFGGDDPGAQWPREVHEALIDGGEVAAVREQYRLDDCQTDVEPLPRATGVDFETITSDHLDFLSHEALFVVSAEFDVAAYRTHWFGLQYESDSVIDSATVGNGALRTVRWYDDELVGDGYTKGEFAALKAVVGDMLDRGVFTREQAQRYMQARLRAWTDSRTELIMQTPE